MPFQRSNRVRVGKLEIQVKEMGPASGREILFLHGNPDTHLVWESVCERLSPYRSIVPDLPGFGASDEDTGALTLDDQARFVRELVDAHRWKQIDLVVHDVGGPYGLAFAALHPERVRSLTIFNTIFSPAYQWHFWARVWRTRRLGELAMKLVNRPLFVRELKRGSKRMPREYADHAWETFTPKTRRTVLRWYRAMDPAVFSGWDTKLLAATASIPKTVIWGDLDPFIPPADAAGFGAPPERVHHLDQCGHWAMLESPARCADLIEDLLARATPATK